VKLRKVLLDTNLYVDWLNSGNHEDLFLGRGLVRYHSAVVQMELRIGARGVAEARALDQLERRFVAGGRLHVPDAAVYRMTADVLRRLRKAGREIRQAAFVHDVLLAASARALGATLFTRDMDFETIAKVLQFNYTVVTH
jgi:predicted nucleic acid-binding protein